MKYDTTTTRRFVGGHTNIPAYLFFCDYIWARTCIEFTKSFAFIFVLISAFLNVFSYADMVCTTAAMGFLRTWIHVPLPLVFAEYLPKER